MARSMGCDARALTVRDAQDLVSYLAAADRLWPRRLAPVDLLSSEDE